MSSSCFICNKIKDIDDFIIMSRCSHRICKICFYQRIFTEHINEFQGQNILKIKCKCENGYSDQDMLNIYELLKEREQLVLMESKENNSEMEKIEKEGCKCKNNDKNLLEFFCLDCQTYMCEDCKKDIKNPHIKHRIIRSNNLIKSLIDNIIKIKLNNKNIDDFEKKFKLLSKNFENLIETGFNKTIKELDELIDNVNDLKEDFIRRYKIELGLYLETFKFIRAFYMNYYKDKADEIKIIETNRNNINKLKYLNNISYELKEIKLNNSTLFNKEISKLMNDINNLKGNTEQKLIEGEFIFEKIKKGFKIGQKKQAHQKFINGLILANNTYNIITSSIDYSMKVWNPENMEEPLQNEKEKVMNLYSLKNGKLLASKDNNLLIFELKETGKYENTQSLTKHDNTICSLTELDDGTIVSGGSDKNIIFWEEDLMSKQYKFRQTITIKKGIQLIIALNDFKLAYAGNDDGYINIMGTKTDLNGDSKIISKDYYHICRLAKIRGKVNCMCKLNLDYFAAGGGDNIAEKKKDHNIYIWKPYGNKYGISQAIFNAHEGDVNCLLLLRDGRFASSSKDRTIKIWEIENNEKAKNNIFGNKMQFIISQNLYDYKHGLYKMIQLEDDTIVSTSSDNYLVFWNNTDSIF